MFWIWITNTSIKLAGAWGCSWMPRRGLLAKRAGVSTSIFIPVGWLGDKLLTNKNAPFAGLYFHEINKQQNSWEVGIRIQFGAQNHRVSTFYGQNRGIWRRLASVWRRLLAVCQPWALFLKLSPAWTLNLTYAEYSPIYLIVISTGLSFMWNVFYHWIRVRRS